MIEFKTELTLPASEVEKYEQSDGMVNLLDCIMQSRDALFEVKLSDGLAAHRRLMELLPK